MLRSSLRSAFLHTSPPDPYTLLAPQLSHLRHSLLDLLPSSHPTLNDITKYYFLHPSKQLRPLLVLLFSRATNGLGHDWHQKKSQADSSSLDHAFSPPDVLNDFNPNLPHLTSPFQPVFSLQQRPRPPPQQPQPVESTPPALASPPLILPTQMRLAQIVEMIHVASLLHDDVIDKSPLRRSAPSAPAAFGNKLAVLAGDFLLGRASAALSRLGDNEVVELIATVLANLVEGEILQMNDLPTSTTTVPKESWNSYLNKTYLKTASLMAKGARAAVVLGGSTQGEIWKEVAYTYGRNLGLAFQLVDDILDYDSAESALGKPGGADLQLGLATGPALFAWEEYPELGPLITRKFEREGDVELAKDYVRRSSGIERTRDLARAHADKAKQVVALLPDSDAKLALEVLTERVVERTW